MSNDYKVGIYLRLSREDGDKESAAQKSAESLDCIGKYGSKSACTVTHNNGANHHNPYIRSKTYTQKSASRKEN